MAYDMILIALIAVFGVLLVFASKTLYELRNKGSNVPSQMSDNTDDLGLGISAAAPSC